MKAAIAGAHSVITGADKHCVLASVGIQARKAKGDGDAGGRKGRGNVRQRALCLQHAVQLDRRSASCTLPGLADGSP
jgi:hypothetical protein